MNNTPAEKLIVRSMFESILLPSASSFGGSLGGSVSRMRQADLLTPVELMVLLHGKEMNLKNAIEGEITC